MTDHLADPPRDVPLLVAVQLLFGRPSGVFGWLFFGFSMIFFWAFAMNADLAALFVFRGELESARGTVSSAEPTTFAEGGSEDGEGTVIYVLHFRFSHGGRQYEGSSYRLSAEAPAAGQPVASSEVGGTVVVEFPRGHPERSRIRGSRSAPFEAGLSLVALLPFVGLLSIAANLRHGWRSYRLLRYGKHARGKLVARAQTNVSVNGQTVYRMTFELETSPGHRDRITVRTHHTDCLMDDAMEGLLYDPARPGRGATMDDLPGSPRIGEDGSIMLRDARSPSLALVPVLLTVVGHGTYLLLRYVL